MVLCCYSLFPNFCRNKHLTSKSEDCNYIEVGGGPSNLPKKYHTIIELPPGMQHKTNEKISIINWLLKV